MARISTRKETAAASAGRKKKGRLQAPGQGSGRWDQWRQKKGLVAWAVLAGFTAVVLMAAVFGEQGLLKVRRLEKERSNLEERIYVVEADTERLGREIGIMHSDPFPYEKAAREKLGLVKPGEFVYDFRSDPLSRP